MKRLTLVAMLVLGMLFAVSCSKDDDNGTNGNNAEVWEGTWLSAGTNVAPILSTYFLLDSVRVTFRDDQTISTEKHVIDGAWATDNGTYTITKSATGDVHSIAIDYSTYEQEGIIEIVDGSPKTMRLEVVQTVPDIAATPRTPESGFGSDVTLGTINIQNYVEID